MPTYTRTYSDLDFDFIAPDETDRESTNKERYVIEMVVIRNRQCVGG